MISAISGTSSEQIIKKKQLVEQKHYVKNWQLFQNVKRKLLKTE